MQSQFSNDAISSILNDAKPYRNVIKRYWTDDEVSFILFLTNSG